MQLKGEVRGILDSPTMADQSTKETLCQSILNINLMKT